MSALNLNAPVFNYTKNYSTMETRSQSINRAYPKESSLNPLNTITTEESAVCEAYSANLPSTNTFQSMPEETAVPAQESFSTPYGAEYNGIYSQNADEVPAAPKLITTPYVNNPFVGEPVGNKQDNDQLVPSVINEEIVSPKGEPVLHPLHNFWTLWYLENDPTKSWEEMQNEITTVGNVEDFWNVYNHIKPPSELSSGYDYSFFKRGIRPMWEDDANIEGGRWVITLNKSADVELDNLWQSVLLCLIGEAFAYAHEVCGAVVNIRHKTNKISVWTADGQNRAAVLEIGTKLREGLHLGRQNLQYQLHKDSMTTHSSRVRPVYVL